MITAPHSREAPNTDATENAISALVRIARAGGHGIEEGTNIDLLINLMSDSRFASSADSMASDDRR